MYYDLVKVWGYVFPTFGFPISPQADLLGSKFLFACGVEALGIWGSEGLWDLMIALEGKKPQRYREIQIQLRYPHQDQGVLYQPLGKTAKPQLRALKDVCW